MQESDDNCHPTSQRSQARYPLVHNKYRSTASLPRGRQSRPIHRQRAAIYTIKRNHVVDGHSSGWRLYVYDSSLLCCLYGNRSDGGSVDNPTARGSSRTAADQASRVFGHSACIRVGTTPAGLVNTTTTYRGSIRAHVCVGGRDLLAIGLDDVDST